MGLRARPHTAGSRPLPVVVKETSQSQLSREAGHWGKATQHLASQAASPGVAGVVVHGVELSELLPCEVRDAQGVPSGDHRVCMVRKQAVLKVL